MDRTILQEIAEAIVASRTRGVCVTVYVGDMEEAIKILNGLWPSWIGDEEDPSCYPGEPERVVSVYHRAAGESWAFKLVS